MKPVLKPELFILLLVQCAVYRHTTKALAQQLKAGGFLFLGWGLGLWLVALPISRSHQRIKKTRQNGDVGKMCVFEPAQKCKNNWDCAVYYDCGTFCCLSYFHRKFETDSVRGKLIFHA